MEEKIKISLPKETLELLKKDCEDFKVFKDDEKINMNAFINALVVNYYEEFSASEETLHDDIKKALFSVPEAYKQGAFDEIVKIFAKKESTLDGKRQSASLSFKPTRQSERAVLFIENILLQNETLSSFYRRMFISYSKKTKNEREKIIHKENYELVDRAISRGVKAYIITRTGLHLTNVSIYATTSSKDELFNYVLSYDGKNNHTLRLANIKSISLLGEKSNIPMKNQELFARQIECAVQYPMYFSDDTPIKVRLTEKGKKLFQKIYLYRPTPVLIEGDVYTFNCSANQLLYYFERFGDSALIISPKKLGLAMLSFHHFALKKYRSIYNGRDY